MEIEKLLFNASYHDANLPHIRLTLKNNCGLWPSGQVYARLISVEDVRNYLSHIIYILIFDFFLNFLSFVRLKTPTSSRCWKEV